MAIAALARISGWSMLEKDQRANYLAGAKRAYEHLKNNNLKYCDDGKENIIDNYCALMAASELFKVTNNQYYLSEELNRASNFCIHPRAILVKLLEILQVFKSHFLSLMKMKLAGGGRVKMRG